MANHLQQILTQWYSRCDECQWVLCTVIDVQGSNYRKLGAMILVSEFGECFGLISGGCLEKSLLNEVKKVISYGRPLRIVYDSSESSESPWARALGCGGKVTVLLQLVTAVNEYLQLKKLLSALNAGDSSYYAVSLLDNCIGDIGNTVISHAQLVNKKNLVGAAESESQSTHSHLLISVSPCIHLAIFGGGVDAVPLVKMADILGWKISLIDHRAGYANHVYSSQQINIYREAPNHPNILDLLKTTDAAIVMTHNIELDALVLRTLQNFSLAYIGLLGPVHRKNKVLAHAGVINEQNFQGSIHGPMGFDIGGDLPESVALSTLAQCHQYVMLHKTMPCEKIMLPCDLIETVIA